MERDQQPQPPPAWHGVAAGLVAGASGVIIGHAFDTAKVQAQVGKTAVVQTPRQFLELYRGILPPLLTTGTMRAFYFGVTRAPVPSSAAGLAAPTRRSRPSLSPGGRISPYHAATAPTQRLKLIQQVTGGSLPDRIRLSCRARTAWPLPRVGRPLRARDDWLGVLPGRVRRRWRPPSEPCLASR